MEIIVPADSPIKTPADLKGQKLGFTDATSNSGFKAPSAILKADFNLEAKRDYEPVFSGKHDNSILGVVNKDYEAAAVANRCSTACSTARWWTRPRSARSTNPRHSRPPVMALRTISIRSWSRKIKEAFFTFPWEGSALQAEFKKEGKFIPIEL